ncbi:hypothetical protein ACP5PY_28495 [Photobacterium leiognathi subsp. mandapamensis]
MKPIFTFNQYDRLAIVNALSTNPHNPYTEYHAFKDYVSSLVATTNLPASLCQTVESVKQQREEGIHVHVLANCPIDQELPELDLDNPVESKYEAKHTFISEGFMELMSQLLETPLFSYQARNNGDFFTDLVSFNKFKGKKTGFTGGDLIYHSDCSYHSVRADYVSLLGLHVPNEQLIYTNYIDVKSLKQHLDAESIDALSKPVFQTEVDDRSKEANSAWKSSTVHPILLKNDRIRYQDTFTKPLDPDDFYSIKALLALKHAMSKADKLRHMVKQKELLIFGNQTGIHNREWIDVTDADEGNKRWLLKTYSFESSHQVPNYSPWATADNTLCIEDK